MFLSQVVWIVFSIEGEIFFIGTKKIYVKFVDYFMFLVHDDKLIILFITITQHQAGKEIKISQRRTLFFQDTVELPKYNFKPHI